MSPAPTARARWSPICAAHLMAAGYRVHVYTSPHLVRFHERIQVDGEHHRRGGSGGAARGVRGANGGEPITFFEITTAAAFLAFSRTPGRHPGDGDRARRPARRDQRGRPAAADGDHAGLARPPAVPGRHAARDRRREGRHHQARRARASSGRRSPTRWPCWRRAPPSSARRAVICGPRLLRRRRWPTGSTIATARCTWRLPLPSL